MAADAPSSLDAAEGIGRFIRENLRLAPVPSLPAIRLYTAHPGSGLRRLLGDRDDAAAPYWAYPWAGGLALARFVTERPELVAGKRVLDLGAGSGLVGIAAAMSNAHSVIAAEIDPVGIAAIALNAAANGVAVTPLAGDMTAEPAPPAIDLVLAGDVFYDDALAGRVMTFLDRCLAAGIPALVGDPGRAHLPRQRLSLLIEYAVPEFGEGAATAMGKGYVFAYAPTGRDLALSRARLASAW
jgi:predicted nicotinamide N-methyase